MMAVGKVVKTIVLKAQKLVESMVRRTVVLKGGRKIVGKDWRMVVSRDTIPVTRKVVHRLQSRWPRRLD